MRIQQLEVLCETKTLDNVFVEVMISIQYSVIQERIWEAYYSLEDHRKQIRAYVEDVVRATLPKVTLDQAFESKEAISLDIKKSLDVTMHASVPKSKSFGHRTIPLVSAQARVRLPHPQLARDRHDA